MQSLELLALSEVNQLCCSSSQMHIHKWNIDDLCFGMGGWDLGLDFVFHTTLALTLTLTLVVVVECYCFIIIIIVGAVGARGVIISYVLHHVLACHLRNPPFYFIKV